ncbi:MAG: anhydro-N-acetylmuramic acid kinase [Bacteroidota bacterium]
MNQDSAISVIGVMSGTSLDGIDIAHCLFRRLRDLWTYEITHCHTAEYSPSFRGKLRDAIAGSASEYVLLDVSLGRMIGQEVRKFCEEHGLSPELIASHGHTIFHDPANGVTTQIGSGADIAVESGYPCVADFRRVDVALGGQGAPLVPFGEKELFTEYSTFLNIGGIANISHHGHGGLLAWDICPANMLLNDLAALAGKSFDDGGKMASEGKVDDRLIHDLEAKTYYEKLAPKSLGREWYEQEIRPLFMDNGLSVSDNLVTACEHMAIRIGHDIGGDGKTVLVTGGGALNNHLMSRIKAHTLARIEVPDTNTVAYKEALIFAFLGLKRFLNEINTLSTVTGASRDSCGGCIYRP